MTDEAITELLFVGSTGAARVEVDHWIDGCGSTRSVFVEVSRDQPLTPAAARQLAAMLNAAAAIAEGSLGVI
jgi:hypothetical protein